MNHSLLQNRPSCRVVGHRTRALCILLVIALGAIIAASLFFTPSTDPPIQQSTVPLSSLARRDGRLYRTNDTQPFTGIALEHYPNGALQSRSAILDGLLHGLSEGWFTNGQVQVTEHFTRGVSDGLRTKWYLSGKKLSEAQIVGGRFEGTFRKWHENGLLAEEIQFANGQPHGISLAWFQTGSPKARARLESGKVVDQQFWKDEPHLSQTAH